MVKNSKEVYLGTLTICHSNICSLLSHGKLTGLGSLTLEENINVVALLESWLTRCVPDQVISLQGFLPPFRCDRDRPYGGVAAYISQIKCQILNLMALSLFGFLQMWVARIFFLVHITDNLVNLLQYCSCQMQ